MNSKNAYLVDIKNKSNEIKNLRNQSANPCLSAIKFSLCPISVVTSSRLAQRIVHTPRSAASSVPRIWGIERI